MELESDERKRTWSLHVRTIHLEHYLTLIQQHPAKLDNVLVAKSLRFGPNCVVSAMRFKK